MKLQELPIDIIVTLPHYLDSLDDLYALIRTSKTLYVACAGTHATFPPRFAKLHGQLAFTPHPHLLVAANARKVANWAVQSTENRSKLSSALKGGIDGLYDLTVDVARMSLTDARQLHSAKYDILNPLTRTIDLEAGPANRAKQYEQQGRSLDDDNEWWTILEYPELTLLNHWIYCELFHHTVTKAYDPSAVTVEPLSVVTRWDFLSYCVPDCNDKRVRVPDEIMHQAIRYAESPWQKTEVACLMLIQQYLYTETEFSVQGVSQRVGITLSREYTQGSKEAAKERLRDRTLLEVLLHQGLLSMRLVLPGGVEATKNEVEVIREKIALFPESEIHLPEGDYEFGGSRHDEVWRSMTDDCSRLIWEWNY